MAAGRRGRICDPVEVQEHARFRRGRPSAAVAGRIDGGAQPGSGDAAPLRPSALHLHPRQPGGARPDPGALPRPAGRPGPVLDAARGAGRLGQRRSLDQRRAHPRRDGPPRRRRRRGLPLRGRDLRRRGALRRSGPPAVPRRHHGGAGTRRRQLRPGADRVALDHRRGRPRRRARVRVRARAGTAGARGARRRSDHHSGRAEMSVARKALEMTQAAAEAIVQRAEGRYEAHRQEIFRATDRMFAGLMIGQWIFAIFIALTFSPYGWQGKVKTVHMHVWVALILGAVITSLPVALAWLRPGELLTRHAIAAGQMLWSALLIHLTGGRIETHFHVFGSLAFLAVYRDWRVLVTATIVVAVDHFARGMFQVAAHRAKLESVNADIEHQVAERTAELTLAHKELQTSEQRFRMLSASAPIGIFEADAAGANLYSNPQWEKITGVSLADTAGRGWERVIHPEDAAEVFAGWSTATGQGREFDREFRLLTTTGEVRWVHSRSAPVRSEVGGLIGHVGTVEDITERKRAQETLSQQARLSALGAEIGVALTRQKDLREILHQCVESIVGRLGAAFARIWT